MTNASRAAALLLGALLLAGCSSDGDAPTVTPASSTAPPTPTTSVDARGFPMPERPACADDAGGDFVTAETSDGNGVGILVIGSGTGGVVLGPQDDGDICQWLPYAEELAPDHRVALYDWADPREEVPGLAAAALRAAGARRIVVGGASYGGATAMSVAHAVRPAPAGVLALGGELRLPGHDFRPGIARWRGPLLEIGSEQDHFFDDADARELRDLHPGPETVLMLPGRIHGVALLHGPDGDRVRRAIEDFLDDVLG